MEKSTIAAIATPVGSGGIGIIRISGDGAFSIAETLFRSNTTTHESKNRLKAVVPKELTSHRLYLGYIVEPDQDAIIDQVMITFMKAPHTYTRENVVEIQSHSGVVVLKRLLDIVLKYGAKLAEPGEFTKRAFLNGRIDLTQAEAIVDVINAKSKKALEFASKNLQGGLNDEINKIKKTIEFIRVNFEAAIEFAGEAESDINYSDAINTINKDVLVVLNQLIKNFDRGDVYREGVKLVVAGKPNVGKSSLLNILLNRERAIVTDLPGTTRDVIEDFININGLPILISDTAGIHHTEDIIEVIGIKKAKDAIEKGDIILFVIDVTAKDLETDRKLLKQLKNKNVIIVLNKSDIGGGETKRFDFISDLSYPGISISALKKHGIEELKSLITQMVVKEGLETGEMSIVPNLRQKELIGSTKMDIECAVDAMEKGLSFEMADVYFKGAISHMDAITGRMDNKDIFDKIFETFCIGK